MKSLKKNPWKRIDGLVGYEPTFDMRCWYHGRKLFLRYSQIITGRSRQYGLGETTIDAGYKCPDCGLVARFNINKTVTKRPDETEYIEEILKRRGGICLYLPPIDVWKSEAEDIKERLESMGYV